MRDIQRASVAARLKHDAVSEGIRVVDYQPGNGYRYLVAVATLPQEESWIPQSVLVSWLYESACMVVQADGELHWRYVQEKMKCTESDARVLTELIAYLVPGRDAIGLE